jgi:hypothetical protein
MPGMAGVQGRFGGKEPRGGPGDENGGEAGPDGVASPSGGRLRRPPS